MAANNCLETTVLILAPLGRDAELAAETLGEAGFASEITPTLDALVDRIAHPCGVVLVAEEALNTPGLNRLTAALASQPPWSDLPIIMLTSGGSTTGTSQRAFNMLAPYGNVTLLERPLRVITLRSTVEVALRARRRQCQVRDLLIDRDKAVADIREANRAKDQFLAALSHELRTPLTPVLMIVGALRQDSELPPRILDELETIQRNVELEARLIDDLLDLTRVTQGKLLLQAEVVDLNLLIDRAVENCRSAEAARKRLRINVRREAANHYTLGDPARLQQILWNILNNASKFTPEGGHIEIVSANPAPSRISIAITDSGIGIDPEVLPKLFDAFEQGDSSITRRFGGLGLGLAISKTLADLQGGTLTASSRGRGQGATFTLELNTTSAPVKADEQGTAASGGGPLPPLRILIAEDHEPTRAALARLLTRAGHEVAAAETVAEALQLAEDSAFDLLISDLGLPDASGLELMRELGSRQQMPGIALSGYGMEEDLRASSEAGFRAHVTKPVDWRRLEDTLHHVLQNSDRST